MAGRQRRERRSKLRRAAFADDCIVALRQFLDELMRMGRSRRSFDLLSRRSRPAISNVLGNRSREEKGLLQWAYPPLAGNSRDSGRMIACLETIPAPGNSSADVGGHLAVWNALRSGASICLHAEHPLTHPSEFPKLRRLSRCLCQLHIVARAPQAFASSVQDFLDLRKKQ